MMSAKAIELLEHLQALPNHDQAAFTELFHLWEANHATSDATEVTTDGTQWPDFMARLTAQWPNGTSGKLLSEIVDEGRGPRP